jgi:hypothetical protein
MPFILNASACPSPPVASGVYDVTTGPLTSKSFSQGDTTSIRGSLNENAARSDIIGRYGGGVYGLCTGYTLSAGSGLTLNVAAGLAMIDGPVESTSSQTVALTDSGRNWVWLSRAGALTVVFNSTTPPAGAYCLLGSALTSGGTISSVDQSGVVYLVGGTAFRRSADTVTPTDSPSSSIQFFHRGASKLWWWDGSSYWQCSPATNAFSQAVIQPSASFTLSQVQTGATEIDLRSGGGVAATFDVTIPSAYATASQEWIFHNNTGQPCRITYQGGSAYVYMQSGQTTHVYFDGSEARTTGRDSFRYGGATVTAPTLTYTAFEQVEYDVFAGGPSGGNAAVEWPTAGALNNKGRRQVVRNDDSGTLNLTVRTAGGAASYDSVLLPGESRSFYINNSGGLDPDNTRPYTRRVGITYPSDANYTVVYPDFLASIIEVSGTLTATRNLVLPTCDHKQFFVYNNTGQSIVVKTSGGTGPTIAASRGALVYCNGTDYKRMTADSVST